MRPYSAETAETGKGDDGARKSDFYVTKTRLQGSKKVAGARKSDLFRLDFLPVYVNNPCCTCSMISKHVEVRPARDTVTALRKGIGWIRVTETIMQPS